MKDIKQIRRRRLALIGILFLLLCGGGYVLWEVQASIREGRQDRRIAEMLRLAEEGEAVLNGTRPDDRARVEAELAEVADEVNVDPELTYTTVLNLYRAHLDETNDADAELLRRFAELREDIATPNGRHVRDARGAWTRLAAKRPDDPVVQRNLARLTGRIGETETATRHARQAVELNPQDPEAAELLVQLLIRGRDYEAAEQAAIEARQTLPNHLPLLRLQIEALILDERKDQAVAAAEAAADAFEQTNPRRFLAEAMAARLEVDINRNAEALLKAAMIEPPDEQYVSDLLVEFDMGSKFEAARRYLADHPMPGPDHPRFGERAKRMYEAGRLPQARALLAEHRFEELPLGLRVVRVLLEQRGGDAEQAAEWVRTLAASPHPRESAWGQLLGVSALGSPPTEQQVTQAEDAVRVTDRDPYALALGAEIIAASGSPERALPLLALAGAARPSWGLPFERMARLHFEADRFKPAMDSAFLAHRAAPHRLWPKYMLLLAGSRAVGDDNRPGLLQLLTMVDTIPQEYVPADQWETITEHRIELLARTDQRDEAAEALTGYLNQDPPPSATSLTRLARIDREHDLGLGNEIFRRSREQYGLSLEMVVERALAEHRNGQTDAGLKLLQDAADAADEPLPWQIAIAKYREAVGDEGALAAYKSLASTYADRPEAQRAVLASGLAWSDLEMISAALERVTAAGLGDEPDVLTHRVRYRLIDGSPQSLTEARTLIGAMIDAQPGSAIAHGFDASLHEAEGELDRAAASLRRAVELSGGDPTYRLDLARVEQRRRAFGSAREQLRVITGDPNSGGPVRLAAAQLMAAQGDTLPAIEVLETLRQTSPDPDTQRDRLLAELYHRAGRTAEAEELLAALLESPTPELLLQTAMLQAGRGEMEAALATLDRLPETAADEATGHRIRAAFHAQFGPWDAAERHFEAALAAEPDSPGIWRSLTLLRLTRDGPAAASATAARAAEAVSDPAGFNAFRRAVENAGDFAARPELLPLLRLPLDDPNATAAVREAFAAVSPLFGTQVDAAQVTATAAELESIAARHGDPIAIHQLAIRLLAASQQFDAAANKAQALAARYPSDGTIAKLAAGTLRDAGRWDDAVVAAERWSRLEPGSEPAAAAVVAEARLHQNAPEAALEALRPHVELAVASPAEHADVIAAYVKTLARIGRAREAAALMQPLMSTGGGWRTLAARVATGYALTDRNGASAILANATEAVADDDPAELLVLAQAWEVVGLRFRDASAADKAVALAERAVQAAESADDRRIAEVWFTYGRIAETAGDTEAAETAYRKTIELADRTGAASNNLAMMLIRDEARLDEALALAKAAVAAHPDNPNYHDTLALVHLGRGELDAAAAAIDKAIRMEPSNSGWAETKQKIESARVADAG